MKDLSILVIEDEPGIVRVLEPTLASAGARVKVAWSGSQGVEYAAENRFDVIICDLGLPDTDGHEVVKMIRKTSDVPIIVLSAREGENERIKALDTGSDDFVPKPFAAGELLARVRAAARRRRADPPLQATTIKLGKIEVDLIRRRLLLEGEEIRLSAREHALIKLLAQSPTGVVTHRQIIDAVWGNSATADTQFVRVLVAQLRQKIEEDPSNPRLLLTEPGLGYRLEV